MAREMTLQAIVLAGARDTHQALLAGTGLRNKALLPVAGQTMLRHVLTALAGSSFEPELYVSSDDPQVLAERAIDFTALPSEGSAVYSMLRSLEWLSGNNHVLFVSCDHPLLTSEMVDYFVESSLRRNLTFSVAVVEREEVRKRYPQSCRTWFPAKGGSYSGGNLFLIDKQAFTGCPEFMEMIDRNRKRPWKSVLRLDLITMVRILLRQLDMHEIARHASGLLGCEVGIIEMPFAECCMDVDKPSDRQLAEQILYRKQYAQSYLHDTTTAIPIPAGV